MVVSFNVQAENLPFEVNGHIEGLKGKKLVLKSLQFGTADSTICKSDSFCLTGSVPASGIYFLNIESKGFVPLFLDSVPICVQGALSIPVEQFEVTGSSDCMLFQRFISEVKSITAMRKQLKNAMERNAVPGMKPTYHRKMDSLKNQAGIVLMNSLERTENQSLISILLVQVEREENNDLVLAVGDKLLQRWGVENVSKSFSAKYHELKRQGLANSDEAERTLLKKYFPPGEKDYILIDFWATWCKPCIESHKLLSNYLLKGNELEIVGMAMDHDSENVRKYLKNNILAGNQRIPSMREKEEISKILSINLYPTFLLLDSERKLIMRRVGKDGLEEILKFLDSTKK